MDWERKTSSRAIPLTACSMGSVTSCSTSVAERPGASVWTTTCGGANSGNTSSFECRVAYKPPTKSSTARTTTTTRLRIDHATMACSMSVVVQVALGLEFLRQQHLGLAVNHRLFGLDSGGQHPPISFPAQDADLASLEATGANPDVDQGSPHVEQERGARHGNRFL